MPPPATMPSSTAARVACRASSTRSFFSLISFSVGAPTRIEAIPPEPYDLVTARALAPLPKLLAYAEKFCQDGTVLLLPKGKSASSELTQARVDWHMDVDTLPSRTDSEATIFRIRGLERRI